MKSNVQILYWYVFVWKKRNVWLNILRQYFIDFQKQRYFWLGIILFIIFLHLLYWCSIGIYNYYYHYNYY